MIRETIVQVACSLPMRQGSATSVCFILLEAETGFAIAIAEAAIETSVITSELVVRGLIPTAVESVSTPNRKPNIFVKMVR